MGTSCPQSAIAGPHEITAWRTRYMLWHTSGTYESGTRFPRKAQQPQMDYWVFDWSMYICTPRMYSSTFEIPSSSAFSIAFPREKAFYTRACTGVHSGGVSLTRVGQCPERGNINVRGMCVAYTWSGWFLITFEKDLARQHSYTLLALYNDRQRLYYPCRAITIVLASWLAVLAVCLIGRLY